MDTSLQELGEALKAAIPRAVTSVALAYGELTIAVKSEAIIDVLTHLRDAPDCLFKSFIDLCGVDYPSREKRFEVVYHLLSPKYNRRIR
ncbi:MAG: NADH-quinone oxidoreductase subunit C, partial [Hyphomicrobiales bacterium]|nr:NADH-quinone oxidoreductase subunit C [Hyphomicrobiales bacterium]